MMSDPGKREEKNRKRDAKEGRRGQIIMKILLWKLKGSA